MKLKVCVMTATRAEYGLLKPLMFKFKEDNDFDLNIVVTGAHLSSEFGFTFNEIINDGFNIDKKIEILLSGDTQSSMTKSMGLAMIGFADYFEEYHPDFLVLLGDRFEALAVAITAANAQIPIVHLHGGETTEGALDEGYRHAITKLSYLHFTSTETYRNRVIQLGEQPENVYSVGALGVENIQNEITFSKSELLNELNISANKEFALVTFHPTTLEESSAEQQIVSLLDVCKDTPDINFVITKANSDAGGRIINKIIDEYAVKYHNISAYYSLGLKKYLSAMKYASFVAGNSSSGILEAPSFKIPTVNIGDRQKGRVQSNSVINCEANYSDISRAFSQALSANFIKKIQDVDNPYGDGNTSKRIIKIIKKTFHEEKLNLKKKFFDI